MRLGKVPTTGISPKTPHISPNTIFGHFRSLISILNFLYFLHDSIFEQLKSLTSQIRVSHVGKVDEFHLDCSSKFAKLVPMLSFEVFELNYR